MTCFECVHGFAPLGFLGSLGTFINGDDVIAPRVETTTEVLDVFGLIGVDGTGAAWEYTDSWARRSSLAAGPTFSATDWAFGDPNALDGADEATIGGLTQPGTQFRRHLPRPGGEHVPPLV